MRRMASAGASAALLIAGLSPLGNALILPLESRFPAATPMAARMPGRFSSGERHRVLSGAGSVLGEISGVEAGLGSA